MDNASEASSEVQPAGEEHPPLPADLYCPECGYNLRGLTSRRCPECGLVLDFIESDTPIIPWERRRELGPFRAYWRTVLMVMFRSKVFCRAMCRPVSYRDSQRFRWVCILHVFIPFLLALPVLWALDAELLSDALEEFGVWFIVVNCVCVLLTLLALTGLPSYFFHPKYLSVERQNRAIVLSYYACAVLAWSPGVLLVFLLASFAADAEDIDVLMLSLAIALTVMVPVLWLMTLCEIAWRTLRRFGSVLGLAVGILIQWAVVGGLLLVVVPFTIAYVLVMIYSLF